MNIAQTNNTNVKTGASTGIGKEVALDMAKRGARVITASRDKERGEESVNDIKSKNNLF